MVSEMEYRDGVEVASCLCDGLHAPFGDGPWCGIIGFQCLIEGGGCAHCGTLLRFACNPKIAGQLYVVTFVAMEGRDYPHLDALRSALLGAHVCHETHSPPVSYMTRGRAERSSSRKLFLHWPLSPVPTVKLTPLQLARFTSFELELVWIGVLLS